MRIFDENGQYTDTFNQYLSETLSPAVRVLAQSIVTWLAANNAKPIDYRVIEIVLAEEFTLLLSSEWMRLVETQIADNEEA